MKRLLPVVLCLALAACGSTDRQFVTDARSTPTGQATQANVGDAVLALKITEPLPNVFGKADMFGRTRDVGQVIVRYMGERNSVAYFSRQNIAIQSTNAPPTSRQNMVRGNGQIVLSAPVGGELLIEGRTLTVLSATGGQVVFSVR